MKLHHLAVAFCLGVTVAGAETPVIRVRVYDYATVPHDTLEKAEREAQRLLQDANLAIHWMDCPPRDSQREARHLACAVPFSPSDILLRIVPQSMQPEPQFARILGYSLPFVGQPPVRAYVLYDNLRRPARSGHVLSMFRLLGYVMAHELAHLLFGDDRHSERGVMMLNWKEKDYVAIDRGTMLFSRDESRLLHAGAVARTQRIAASAGSLQDTHR